MEVTPSNTIPGIAPYKRRGNGCGHDPKNLRAVIKQMREIKPKNGLPAILVTAGRKIREWYSNPGKFFGLFKPESEGRLMRSERREAVIIVLETALSFMNLSTMWLGTPTVDKGFVDISMDDFVKRSGLGKRRCERVFALLKRAGLFESKQPRGVNEQGKYYGLRAIRSLSTLLFERLGLDRTLKRERKKEDDRLNDMARRHNIKMRDLLERFKVGFKPNKAQQSPKSCNTERLDRQAYKENCWISVYQNIKKDKPDISESEARSLTNSDLGFDHTY